MSATAPLRPPQQSVWTSLVLLAAFALASCSPPPAEDASGGGGDRATPATNPSAHPESLLEYSETIGGLSVSISSDFSDAVVVRVQNPGAATVYLAPNFGATSRIDFFDATGNPIDNGGFEGRPAQMYTAIDPRDAVEMRYDHSFFTDGSLRQAHRVCINARVASTPGLEDRLSQAVCLDRPAPR